MASTPTRGKFRNIFFKKFIEESPYCKVIILFLSISAACASTLRCPGYLPTGAVIAHANDITKFYKCHESRYLIEMQCDRGMEFDSHRAVSRNIRCE